MSMRRIVPGLGFLAIVVYGLSGWMVVEPGESVVVRRFGRALAEPWGPGPHLGAPIGIDTRVRVRPDEVRTIEVGREGVAGLGDDPGSGEFLTADGNLVQARATVQYRISDPLAFLANADDAPAILARLAESALARSIARTTIDDALAAGGAAVSAQAEAQLLADLDHDDQRLGLSILGFRLTHVRPPAEVQADFDRVQTERSRADQARIEAESKARVLEAEARAAATARTIAAQSRADRAVAIASARADRFSALRNEAQRDRKLTAERLYRDTLRALLPGIGRKVVIGDDQPIDLSVLGITDPPTPAPTPTRP